MGRMHQNQRDHNDREIFLALKAAGCDPRRGTEVDIFAKHVDGHGVMIEVKNPLARPMLRPIQIWLRDTFGPQGLYHIVYSFEEALKVCGR